MAHALLAPVYGLTDSSDDVNSVPIIYARRHTGRATGRATRRAIQPLSARATGCRCNAKPERLSHTGIF